MTRRILMLLAASLALAACTLEEEVVVVEPVMEEKSMFDCDPVETDGIGGTGCEPVN